MKNTVKRALQYSRYLLLFLIAIHIAQDAMAQEGTVTYEEVIKLNIELPPEMAHMAEDIPNSQTNTQILYFNESAALLKNAPEPAEDEINMHSQDGVVRIQMSREENEFFFDFDEDRKVEKRDFMGRVFLIEDEAFNLSWRLGDEKSEFLGYMCQKATATVDSTTYEAWFTPELSVPAGPGAGGLPGLILVLNINDGQRSFVAQELSLGPVEKGVIVPPKKGKKVSQSEFDAIVAEKMKEMEMNSGGSGVFIRMRN